MSLAHVTHHAAASQVDAIPFETFFMPEEELDTGGSVDSEDETKYDEVMPRLQPPHARGASWLTAPRPSVQAIEDGGIDAGEMVAQHLYLYIYDLQVQEEREWSDDETAEGTIVFDSDSDTTSGGA